MTADAENQVVIERTSAAARIPSARQRPEAGSFMREAFRTGSLRRGLADSMRVLVTGGAGFIGSHLADRLLAEGHEVRALDNLDPQVHAGGERPGYLDPQVELVAGDVRDREAVRSALDGIDTFVHFAAAVGVGQSMYEIERYTSINAIGAAVLLEEVLERRDAIRKLLVASSMSIYAINKRDHEEMTLAVGAAYGIPSVALRFFNVFGERQSLSNPYTGVAAIFASRLLNDHAPLVFEDGDQTRDFIDVRDIARCCSLALSSDGADGRTLNVGTGVPTSIVQVAHVIAAGLGKQIEPEIIHQYRAGDIRHCYADTKLAQDLLGFRAGIPFERGMDDLLAWLQGQEASDSVDAAREALVARGLAR